MIEKVTALITRRSADGPELLLFEHPYAGIQIPAGTVDPGETPLQAARREAAEETGLVFEGACHYLGCEDERLSQEQCVIVKSTQVYARPDLTSFDWGYLSRGIQVSVKRSAPGFVQVEWIEHDRDPDPQYVSMCILGWVPEDTLTDARRRHFFHLEFEGETPDRWPAHTDCHTFTLFWSPLAHLPAIIYPQNRWLKFLPAALKEQVG